METFFVSPDQFWEWFNRPNTTDQPRQNPEPTTPIKPAKRMRIDERPKPKHVNETAASNHVDNRYVIMWARPKPGKKNKTWEGDGYLYMAGQLAHLTDLKGRLLEEPTLLDHMDYQLVEEMGELTIGGLEVQIVEKE